MSDRKVAGPRSRQSSDPPSPADALRAELDSLFATAVELHKQGHLQQAAALYDAILRVDGAHADALHLRGVVAHSAGDYEGACGLISRAIEINAHAAPFHFNLGVSLQALSRHQDAAAAYRRALQLQPRYVGAHENLGVALQDSGDYENAEAAYRAALSLDPQAPIAHQNLGTLLGNRGQMHEAREHFDVVLRLHPAYGDAHTKRAWTLLAEGRFEEGWDEYEWRWLSESFVANNRIRVVPYPGWDGAPLAGKTVLIHPEQGLGDELMFATCYRDVIGAAARCVIECDPRLATLFCRSFPDALVLPREADAHFRWTADLPPIDYRVAAGSLPRFFRKSLADFPADTAYLRPDPTLVREWRRKLAGHGKRLTIGISWRGGRDPRSSAARSIPLAEWQPVLSFADAAFVNLQYGDHSAEIAAFERDCGLRLHSLPDVDPFNDLEQLAAAIAALDLVVSIDNSTVFIAGAVGTPAWVLLPASGEWRWLQDRSSSPWFGSLTLWRQKSPGLSAWRDLLEEVAGRLGTVPARPNAAEEVDSPVPRPLVRPREPRAPAVFLNDSTTYYHYGCTCTSLGIHAELRKRCTTLVSLPMQEIAQLAEVPSQTDAFDDDEQYARFAATYPQIVATLGSAEIVYVNGEGALHNVGQQARGLLYLMHVAKTRLGRTVHLINHSCYPDDRATLEDSAAVALYEKVYANLDFVAVRETLSLELVRRMGIEAVGSFDCLPLFVQRHFHPPVERARRYVVVAGSVSWGGGNAVPALAEYIDRMHAAGYPTKVLIGADAYIAADDLRLVNALRARCGDRFELVRATSPLEWLGVIADAALLVSGRFHYTLAAAFVDTPFIVMESNTPKIAGILQMLRSPSFVSAHDPRLIDELYERSRQYIGHSAEVLVPDEIKAQLLELARRNFAAPTL